MPKTRSKSSNHKEQPLDPRSLFRRVLLSFLRLLYTDLAWAYDAVAWLVSAGEWINWARLPISNLKEGKTLELGFGPGHLMLSLLENRSPVFGIDLSRQMIRQAARRLTKNNLPIPLSRSRSQALPFPDHTFQNILSTFPSDYIFKENSISEIQRVLKPGGSLQIVLGTSGYHKPANFSFLGFLHPILYLVSKLSSPAGTQDDQYELLRAPFRKAGFDPELVRVHQKFTTILLLKAAAPVTNRN